MKANLERKKIKRAGGRRQGQGVRLQERKGGKGLPSGKSYGWRSHGRHEAAVVDGKNILICTFPAFTARTSWRTSKGESLGLSSKSGRCVL